ARQTRVAWRIDIASTHAVAGLEFRRCGCRALETAARERFRSFLCRERAGYQLGRMQRMTGCKLVIANKSELHAQARKPELPFFVIAAAEVDMRWQGLAGVSADIDAPQAEIAHGAVHGENTTFPRRMEYRFIRFGLDLTETVHAAHV